MLARLLKNYVSLTLATFVAKVVGFFSITLVTRSLDQAQFGSYSLALTMQALGAVLAVSSLEYAVIRMAAQDRARSGTLMTSALALVLSLVVVTALAFMPIAMFLAHSQTNMISIVMLAAASLFFMGPAAVSSAIVKAHEHMEIIAAMDVIGALCSMGLIWLTIRLGGGVCWLVATVVVTEALRCVALASIIRYRFGILIRRAEAAVIRTLLRMLWPIAVLTGSGILLRYVDIVLLGAWRPLSDVAILGAVTRLTDILSVLSMGIVTSLYPAFCLTSVTSREESWRLYHESTALFGLCGFGVAFLVVALSEPILHQVFGASYVVGAMALRLRSIAFLFGILGGPVGTAIMADEGQVKSLILLGALILAIKIGCDLWLIPRFGYDGASYSLVISSFLGFVIRILLSRLYFGRRTNILRLFWRPVVASLAAWLLSAQIPISLYVHVIVWLLLYVAFLLLLGELKEKRYRPLLDRLHKRRAPDNTRVAVSDRPLEG